jgi:hypothetical protein
MCLSPMITFSHFILPVNTFIFCIEQMLAYHVHNNSVQEQETYCHNTIKKKIVITSYRFANMAFQIFQYLLFL